MSSLKFFIAETLDMTTYIEDIRNHIYFKLNGFVDIYECFVYYTTRELSKKDSSDLVDQMRLTTTSWDFKQMKSE